MKREPLRDRIRRRLVEDILTGGLSPGEKIPLASTAEEIGVSMTPLRETLVQFEREGLVHSNPGRGYTVATLDPEEVRQVYPLIWTLEVLALRSDPPGGNILEELDRVNARFGDDPDPDTAMRLDLEWHRTLLSRSRNALLQQFLSQLKTRAARYELAYMRDAGNVAYSADQHGLIVEHLRAGDLDEAAVALENNWRIGPEILLPWLEARRGASTGDVEPEVAGTA